MILLITGVAGFIGSNFTYYYLNKYKHRTIIGLDKLTYAGNLNNLSRLDKTQKNRFKFVKGDISDRKLLKSLFKKYEITGIINFAAESHVDRSINDSEQFIKTNIIGTHCLLDIAKEHWIVKGSISSQNNFLQVSTDEVYGTLGKSDLFTEKTPLDPRSPYSASKASADLLVKSYSNTYGLPINITRCSNNYGPYQFPEKLIPFTISNILNNKNIPVYGDGKNIRDWIYVDDHCTAIDLVFENAPRGEIYNIGGRNEKENISVVKEIIQTVKNRSKNDSISEKLIKYVKDRPGHDRRYAINPSKIENDLGWESKIYFNEGIQKTVDWYLNNQQWLLDVSSGNYSNLNNIDL